jgi:glutamyl-tRNA reductase
VTDVVVYSPTGRGARFAANHGIEAVASNGYAMAAAGADLIVTCTVVDHHVVDRGLLELGRTELAVAAGPTPVALLPGRERDDAGDAESDAPRQLVIDLGLPRNVDPDVAELPGVELLDLETVKIHAPLEEFGATDAARELVERAARNFGRVAEELDLAPAVVALRTHVFDVLDAEIERARARGDDDGRTEKALRHMAGVLLHTPMVRSREYARAGEQQAWLEGLEAIFGIRPETDAAASAGTDAADAADRSRDERHRDTGTR